MVQPATVVPSAAAAKPATGMSPTATAAFTPMAQSANRNGLRVSSRAKNSGWSTLWSTKAGRPSP
jgi:hypothetical protein